ncbi:MAG: hypothetical protein LJF30_04465 [Acidobacteria bacterium]|nr:hypothetical protein [Acidobacteriota bacterium]
MAWSEALANAGGCPDGAPARRLGLTLCFLALPAVGFGQSLGEAARKEREQRKKTTTEVKVVTEDELASNEGQLANDPGTSAPEPAPRTRRTRRLFEAEMPGVNVFPVSMSKEEFWRDRARHARNDLAYAKKHYEALVRQISIGQPARFDENGRRVIYSAQTMKAWADKAEAELRAAEKALADLHEEARRAGALPGWLRE